MTLRQARRLPLDSLQPYLLEAPETAAPLDWTAVFGNNQPVEIEVGFGKGLFLLTSALAHPDVNYLGIEVMRKYQLFTATRISKRGLPNVRLVKADAREFLRDHIAARSCRAVHVYFPDPWWKNRHRKRRVFTAEFAVECERVLVAGGHLLLATDVEEYFGVMTGLVRENTQLRPLGSSWASDTEYQTNFEKKSLDQGRPIHRQQYERA